jgi:hypothetical protein
MRFLFVFLAALAPIFAKGQNQLEWNWNRMHIAIDSSVRLDLAARSPEIIREFHEALIEAENTLGYKASGSLHFQAYNDLTQYELALAEHSVYRHLQGLSVVDANDGIFPLYLHATSQELKQQLRWGIAYGLLREYLFGITVKQRFDQAKLTQLPAWILYGYCRYFAMGWNANDQDEWRYFYDNRAFQNSNHIMPQGQDVYGQFVWKELVQTLGTGTLSSFWFVIKYTGQVDAAFQYHLGMDFHEWMQDHQLEESTWEGSSSLFQSDLDWGYTLMGHPILEMALDSVPNRGTASFYWPGKQVIAFSDFEHNHRWIRMREQVALCRELSFNRALFWNHKDGHDWESLWKENDRWVWTRWSNRGELQQREEWEFKGHPLQVFYLESNLYITEQIGAKQQASPFGHSPLPLSLTSWKEAQSLSLPSGSNAVLFSVLSVDSTGSAFYSSAHQTTVDGLSNLRVESCVSESQPYWSLMAQQQENHHWIFGSDSGGIYSILGELPVDGYFPVLGNTTNPQSRYISDYRHGQARVRLYSIKNKPDSLSPLLLQGLNEGSEALNLDSLSSLPQIPTVQFLGPFAKPEKTLAQLGNRQPVFPEFELSTRLRWYYIKHASIKLSNRRSPLLVPVQLPMGSLFNSVLTPDFYTEIGSSDLKHRLELQALISPDFKRNSMSLSQEYDLTKSLTLGHNLQLARRRVLVQNQNKHWQAWNLDVFAISNGANKSQFESGLRYEHSYLGTLFTTDAALQENSQTQGLLSFHLDWIRNCHDWPFFRLMDQADYRASLVATHSPGYSGMGSADFQLTLRKKSGRQLQWDAQVWLHYAPGKDAIIQWVGGSPGWTSQSAWSSPYAGIFNQRSGWQQQSAFIRGFQSGTRLGSSFAVLNQTLSSPVLQYLHKGLMHSEFSKSLIVYAFNDVGTAFFGPTPQAEGNPFNTQYLNTPNYALSITSKRNPYVASAGIGLQTKVLGYHWRLERAWGYMERKVQSPLWHISMGKTIDWE